MKKVKLLAKQTVTNETFPGHLVTFDLDGNDQGSLQPGAFIKNIRKGHANDEGKTEVWIFQYSVDGKGWHTECSLTEPETISVATYEASTVRRELGIQE